MGMQPHPYLKKAYQSESRLISYKIFAFKKKLQLILFLKSIYLWLRWVFIAAQAFFSSFSKQGQL